MGEDGVEAGDGTGEGEPAREREVMELTTRGREARRVGWTV